MANTKANLNITIDSGVNELATVLLERMGLDQATAIDMFFRQIIIERRLPFQPAVLPTLDEQIAVVAERRAQKKVELATDENGNVIVDKELHPEIYDWAING
jgi:addiction module RelB/DinJ family antitoxin